MYEKGLRSLSLFLDWTIVTVLYGALQLINEIIRKSSSAKDLECCSSYCDESEFSTVNYSNPVVSALDAHIQAD